MTVVVAFVPESPPSHTVYSHRCAVNVRCSGEFGTLYGVGIGYSHNTRVTPPLSSPVSADSLNDAPIRLAPAKG